MTSSRGKRPGPGRRTVLKSLGAAGVVAAAPSLLPARAFAASSDLGIDWSQVTRVSKTNATLQVVVNALLRRDSPIHDNVFREIRALGADYVRFVPWYPYPRLGVAELEAPSSGGTSWDFSLIDPIVEDFLQATRGHSTILNFSTTPEWMWEPTPWTVSNGQLTVTGGDIGLSQAGSDWTDYSFAADVTPLATGQTGGNSYAQAGLVVRMDETLSGYCFLLSNFPYTSPAAPGYIVFLNVNSDSPGTVHPVALPFAVTGGETYPVVITASGSTFTVTVNGTAVATFTDATYTSGGVGFREDTEDSESAMFANVQVTGSDGTLLLSEDFSGGLSQWNPPIPGSPPSDPDAVDFGYPAGTSLIVPVQTLADYYHRLVSWYTRGGFTDENGTFRKSGHHYHLPYWEVLNEVNAEHSLSPQLYTQLYDAIVPAIRSVSPQTQFVGLALGQGSQNPDYISYFLDPANHAAGVPVDLISYHYYAPASGSDPQAYGTPGFAGADSFLSQVDQIEAIRMQLAPQVRTTVDETGTILDIASTQTDPAPVPDAYWNYSAAIYAYLFANLALRGIDIVGESQMVGYPGQFPSVSMVDWNTGLPNARYRALQLLLEEMPPGIQLVPASGAPDGCFVLGFIHHKARKLLVVNKTDAAVTVPLPSAAARARVVDLASGGGPISTQPVPGNQLALDSYGVAVVTLSS